MRAGMTAVTVMVLVLAIPVYWVAEAQISDFGEQPVRYRSFLKKRHSSIQSRPPP